MKDLIKKRTEELEKEMASCSSSNRVDITAAAVTYFISNKDKLKYLLSAHIINDRSETMLNHLIINFGDIDRNVIIKLLNKEKIYSKSRINFLTYVLPAILLVAVLFISTWSTKSLGVFLISVISSLVLYFIWAVIFENRNKTKALTYRLSKEHRSLCIPSSYILNKRK